jgi:hypothetical protein
MPGYRENEERINRTNMYWNTGMHDVPNCEWEFDDRLPVLFRYGFAYGFNQMVLPKGRVVALDKAMNKIHWDTKKARNTMTLANGGVPVRLREASDLYKATEGTASEIVSPDMQGKNVLGAGKEWVPVVGMEKAYSKKAFRPFVDNSAEVAEGQDAALVTPSKQLTDAGYKIDAVSGRVVDENGVVVDTVRDANIPIGVLENNQYTKDVDAYNGMMCGPVRTDAMITLPWFVFKDKAEGSYWGSIYGADVRPGALLKSDENGRLVVSPLSIDEELATMSAKEIELERRQVVGEVYSAVQELLPAGAAKWATWALADRLNYEYFNPTMWRETNRRGEDSTNQSPYATTGEYPGYPYDKAFTEHNLHMLGANLRNNNYNHRMDFEYQYSELGIPGLTDGFNAVVREFPEEKMGEIHFRGAAEGYLDQMFQTLRVDLEPGTLEVKLDVVAADGSVAAGNWVKAVVGQSLDATGAFALNYVSELQGVVKVQMAADKADAVLKDGSTAVLYARYQKRGLAGVPTFMDWDGCIGSVQVLLNK